MNAKWWNQSAPMWLYYTAWALVVSLIAIMLVMSFVTDIKNEALLDEVQAEAAYWHKRWEVSPPTKMYIVDAQCIARLEGR